MSSSAQGYKKKPFWIIGTAVLLMATPYFHLMWILRSAGETHWYAPTAMLKWIPHLHPAPAVISILLILGGISLLFVKKWAWWLGMFSLTALCLYNITIIQEYYSEDPGAAAIGSILSAALLLLLFLSDFKKPFYNQRLRWWESDPRFHVNVPVKIKDWDEELLLCDISKSGILLESKEGKDLTFPPEAVIVINSELELPCVYSRSSKNGAAYKLINVSRFQSRYLKNWLNLLAKDPDRKVR